MRPSIVDTQYFLSNKNTDFWRSIAATNARQSINQSRRRIRHEKHRNACCSFSNDHGTEHPDGDDGDEPARTDHDDAGHEHRMPRQWMDRTKRAGLLQRPLPDPEVEAMQVHRQQTVLLEHRPRKHSPTLGQRLQRKRSAFRPRPDVRGGIPGTRIFEEAHG